MKIFYPHVSVTSYGTSKKPARELLSVQVVGKDGHGGIAHTQDLSSVKVIAKVIILIGSQ